MPPSRRSAEVGFAAIWRRRGPAARLLFPFSLLFRGLSAMRRAAYRGGCLSAERLTVPVVVVGNITVGGTGKTPLVIHLAQVLRDKGRRPGIISRGYRGNAELPIEVRTDLDPGICGDEALVLARNSGCPVFVGRDRVAAGKALLAAHPDCDLMLADDGLQHYRLARELEIAVFDARGVANGWCLPAGPLREPVARLRSVDALVVNLDSAPVAQDQAPVIEGVPAGSIACPVFSMRLRTPGFRGLVDPRSTVTAAELAGRKLHAVAGIGSPERFFDLLRRMGLAFEAHPFPDHHAYRVDDFDFLGDAVLTTEKDAVKLTALKLPLPVWVLPVSAQVTPDLGSFVLEKLNGRPSA